MGQSFRSCTGSISVFILLVDCVSSDKLSVQMLNLATIRNETLARSCAVCVGLSRAGSTRVTMGFSLPFMKKHFRKDNHIGMAVKQGRFQVQDIRYAANGVSTVKPLTDWLDLESAKTEMARLSNKRATQ